VSFLLDTCVISELVRPRPQPSVVSWIEAADEQSLFLSVLTLGELEKGIARSTDLRRRAKLTAWVRRHLTDRFRGRLVSVDAAVATRWGMLAGESEARGKPLSVIDSLLAATSLEHRLVVVTRNTADLERCGARCLNPWRA